MRKITRKCIFDYENIKKGAEKCKKCTSDEENIKKWAKKCQKVHLGNSDIKILESGKNALLMMKILKSAPKSAKKCTYEILTPKS